MARAYDYSIVPASHHIVWSVMCLRTIAPLGASVFMLWAAFPPPRVLLCQPLSDTLRRVLTIHLQAGRVFPCTPGSLRAVCTVQALDWRPQKLVGGGCLCLCSSLALAYHMLA